MILKTFTFQSQKSFRRQLLQFFILSVAVITIATTILTAWQTQKAVKASIIEDGIQITSNLASRLPLALLTGSEENAKDAVESALGFQSVQQIVVFKSDFDVLLEVTKNKAFLVEQQLSIIEVHFSNVATNFESNSSFSKTAQNVFDGENSWLIVAPVIMFEEAYDDELVEPDTELENEANELIGFVVVEYDKNELNEIQNSILFNNISIASVMTLLVALIMSWGIKHLTRPLTLLAQIMNVTGQSKKFLRAPEDGAKEIRMMAQTYNQMIAQLEVQKQQLENHRDNLETEVEVRTQELKTARDAALTASRHKSEFLANISHELRTPIQAIIGYTDLVKEELELECMDSQAEDLGKSIRAANNLLSLINNILDVAKIEAGRMDVFQKSVDMQTLIRETVDTVIPMANANSNELIVNSDEVANSLVIDRQKVMQVMLNLLSNACKFTHDGIIHFDISNDSRFLYFSVQDTGIGIPKDKLDLIFEEFTQVDGSQTRRFEGTGLGMAISSGFCELMKGTLDVESEENVGSKFSVRIPIEFD